jgi:hypothetical protein
MESIELDFNEELSLPSGDTRSMFEKPVPGQSLTEDPGKYPWDKPPQYTNIDDVMQMYMGIVTDDDTCGTNSTSYDFTRYRRRFVHSRHGIVNYGGASYVNN